MTSLDIQPRQRDQPDTLLESWRQITHGLPELAAQTQHPEYGIDRSWLTETAEWPADSPTSRYLYVSHMEFPRTRSEALTMFWKDEHYHDIMDTFDDYSEPSIAILRPFIDATALINYPEKPRSDYYTYSRLILDVSTVPVTITSRELGRDTAQHIRRGLQRHTLKTSADPKRYEWIPAENAFAPEYPHDLRTDRIATADFLAIAQAITYLICTSDSSANRGQ